MGQGNREKGKGKREKGKVKGGKEEGQRGKGTGGGGKGESSNALIARLMPTAADWLAVWTACTNSLSWLPCQAKAQARPVGPVLLRPAVEPAGPTAEPARPAAERNKSGPVGRARAKFTRRSVTARSNLLSTYYTIPLLWSAGHARATHYQVNKLFDHGYVQLIVHADAVLETGRNAYP